MVGRKPPAPPSPASPPSPHHKNPGAPSFAHFAKGGTQTASTTSSPPFPLSTNSKTAFPLSPTQKPPFHSRQPKNRLSTLANPKTPGAPSFAPLRRVGCKPPAPPSPRLFTL